MKPLPPEVKGPISVCNKSVRVRGHIAGATVTILVNNNLTSSSVSNWPDDEIDVGVQLVAGDKITATQEFGGEVSEPSPLAIIVQAAPTSLSSVTILTHLYQCGNGLWAEGVVPGAEVKALINNFQVGQKTSVDGIARMQYQPGLQVNQSLYIVQTTCNSLTGTNMSNPADTLPDILPVPVIQTPLIECQTSIKLNNLLDGATVILYRNGSEVASVIVDRSSGTWKGLSPLQSGEKIEIAQAFYCRHPDAEPTKISGKALAIVEPVDKLNAPKVHPPLCPNGIMVTISNLIAGARVIIFQDDNPIGMTDAPGSSFNFYVPPLVANSKITARMQLCEKDGPMSDAVDVDGSDDVEGLDVSTLYECASYIYTKFFGALSQSGGSIVYVLNKQSQMISNYHQVFGWDALVPVSPALVINDEITIVLIGCNGAERKFGPFKVESLPDLVSPEIFEPVTEGQSAVIVFSDVAGALLSLYVDGVFAGQKISGGEKDFYPKSILLQKPLLLGQALTAKQTLCGRTSKFSEPVIVVIPYPKPPKLIKPANDSTGVGTTNLEFEWEDPGSNTSAAATSFILKLFKSNNLIHQGGTNTTSYTINFNLDYDTQYNWWVEASNSTGKTASNNFEFTTEEEPPQQPPEDEEAILAFITQLYAGSDCINELYPVPANQAFKLFIGVGNVGNATSQPFQVLFEAYDSDGNFLPPSIPVDFQAFNSGQADTACIDVAALPEGQYTFYASLIVNNQIIESTYYGAWIGF
jgi:hypothetical protein